VSAPQSPRNNAHTARGEVADDIDVVDGPHPLHAPRRDRRRGPRAQLQRPDAVAASPALQHWLHNILQHPIGYLKHWVSYTVELFKNEEDIANPYSDEQRCVQNSHSLQLEKSSHDLCGSGSLTYLLTIALPDKPYLIVVAAEIFDLDNQPRPCDKLWATNVLWMSSPDVQM